MLRNGRRSRRTLRGVSRDDHKEEASGGFRLQGLDSDTVSRDRDPGLLGPRVRHLLLPSSFLDF